MPPGDKRGGDRIAVTDECRLGIDIGGTKLLVAVLREGSRDFYRLPTGSDTRPADITDHVMRVVRSEGGEVASLGIAVPGLVNGEGEVIGCDVLPHLTGWRPADSFAALKGPVVVLNDAGAAMVEETSDLGPGANAGVVMAGTAIGAAFMVEGVPLRGAGGWAGELGYLPVRTADGVQRLDEVAAGMAITGRLGITGAEVKARADECDLEVLREIRRAGAALGLGLASVVNLLNPELLVLAGGLLDLPGYRRSALRSAARHALPELWKACTIRSARAGSAVVALGAARAAARRNAPD